MNHFSFILFLILGIVVPNFGDEVSDKPEIETIELKINQKRIIEEFHSNLYHADLERVRFNLEMFPELANISSEDGFCPIIFALHNAHAHDRTKQLLGSLYLNDADFNCVSKKTDKIPFDFNPLAYVLYQAPFLDETIPYLLKYGADPNHPSVMNLIEHYGIDISMSWTQIKKLESFKKFKGLL